jgi:hypothetical protein
LNEEIVSSSQGVKVIPGHHIHITFWERRGLDLELLVAGGARKLN